MLKQDIIFFLKRMVYDYPNQQDIFNKAIIKIEDSNNNDYLLAYTGNYWTIENINMGEVLISKKIVENN